MINSLLPGKSLNGQFWPNGPSGKLLPEVRKKLLQIAIDFKSTLNLTEIGLDGQLRIVDCIFTGSLANFNWSSQSDVDLHIRLDITDVLPEYQSLVREFLTSKRYNYAAEHDIVIFGFDVEVYPELTTEALAAGAVYSLVQDKWLIEPHQQEIRVDKVLITKKTHALIDFIDRLIQDSETLPFEQSISLVDKVVKKIKKMRQASLNKGGEYHEGNLIFKVLRRTGYMDKLYDLRTKLTDQHLSLERTTGITKAAI